MDPNIDQAPYHHHDDYYSSGYEPSHHHHRAYSWGAVAVIIIVIIIVIVLIWWFTRRPPLAVITPVNGGNTGVTTSWMYVQGNAASADTFTASNNTIYRVAGTSGGTSLTIIPPSTTASGQQFIIDNTQGAGTVTITGVTVVSGAGTNVSQANVVPRGRTAWFVWSSTSSVIRLT